MKSFTLTRGGGPALALMLLHAPTALAAPAPAAATVATAPAERTRLNLGTAASSSHSAAGGGASIVRTIVGLFVVIGVIYGVAWILRQFRKGSQQRATGNGLAALASLPLGPSRSIQLVRAGEEVILLGISESGVTPIRTYTEGEARELGLDVAGTDGPAPSAGARPLARRQLADLIETLRQKTIRG
jgi:flagellar protein FliO/FliZ